MKNSFLLSLIIILAGCSFSTSAYCQQNLSTSEKLLLDYGWRFSLSEDIPESDEIFYAHPIFNAFQKSGEADGAVKENYVDSTWRKVDLPHEWSVELNFVNDWSTFNQGYKPVGYRFPKTSIGWYRKSFTIPREDDNKRITIKFDGVFRNCTIWLNDLYVGSNLSGYNEFSYDVTDFINYGGKNTLVVRVDASDCEGWFYEGAGIYRHVWLLKQPPVHIPLNGTYITTDIKGKSAVVNVETEITNKDNRDVDCQLGLQIVDETGITVKSSNTVVKLKKGEKKTVLQHIIVSNPELWSVDRPYLYKLVSVVSSDGPMIDKNETNFGIRTIFFDKDLGFFLNGKSLKIKGTCNHQDHAGVGSALPDRLQYYRIERLKEMGCNAYRTSHNPPTPELLDACDRLGMLVMDENRLLNSSPEYLGQFERFIRRDRNHPSVILWSIGNEEMVIQKKESGKRIALTLKELQEKLDPSRKCVYAANNGNFFEGINSIMDIRGINYMGITDVDLYRKDHPDQILVGSEEASTLCTRGEYFVSQEQGYMSDYDKKENSFFKWCSNAESWWKFYSARPWLAGGFAWTGFDYRGEPGNYMWPCINSNFGIMDVCGFPKNNFYYYQAWWTEKDVLHLYPHWNWSGRTGDTINVWCQTNCQQVELFLNGKSLGTRQVAKNSHIEWDVVYEPGILEAIGLRNGKKIIQKIETTGPSYQLAATTNRVQINADGEDICVVNITAVDDKGLEVPTANDFITFKIEGNGKIIGVGNGNPSSHEPDKILKGNYYRRLFNGKCQVIVQASRHAGDITLTSSSNHLKPSVFSIKAAEAPERPYLE